MVLPVISADILCRVGMLWHAFREESEAFCLVWEQQYRVMYARTCAERQIQPAQPLSGEV